MITKETKRITLELEEDDLEIVRGMYDLLNSFTKKILKANTNFGTTYNVEGDESCHMLGFLKDIMDLCDDLNEDERFIIEVEDD